MLRSSAHHILEFILWGATTKQQFTAGRSPLPLPTILDWGAMVLLFSWGDGASSTFFFLRFFASRPLLPTLPLSFQILVLLSTAKMRRDEADRPDFRPTTKIVCRYANHNPILSSTASPLLFRLVSPEGIAFGLNNLRTILSQSKF